MARKTVDGPFKSAIRQGKDGIVRAYLLPSDQPHPVDDDAPIMTIAAAAMRNVPHTWELFKEIVKELLDDLTTHVMGVPPIRQEERAPPGAN